MASKYLQKYPVPEKFPVVLHDFTREILREQPDDILAFAVEYFQCLQEGKTYEPKSKYNPPRENNKPKAQLEYKSGAAHKEIKPREGTMPHQSKPQPQVERPSSNQRPVDRPPSGQHVSSATQTRDAARGQASHQTHQETATEDIKAPYYTGDNQPKTHPQIDTPQGSSAHNTIPKEILSPQNTTHPEEKAAMREYMAELNDGMEGGGGHDAPIEQPAAMERKGSRPISAKSGRSQKSGKSEQTHPEEKNAAHGYLDELTEGVLGGDSRPASGKPHPDSAKGGSEAGARRPSGAARKPSGQEARLTSEENQ